MRESKSTHEAFNYRWISSDKYYRLLTVSHAIEFGVQIFLSTRAWIWKIFWRNLESAFSFIVASKSKKIVFSAFAQFCKTPLNIAYALVHHSDITATRCDKSCHRTWGHFISPQLARWSAKKSQVSSAENSRLWNIMVNVITPQHVV